MALSCKCPQKDCGHHGIEDLTMAYADRRRLAFHQPRHKLDEVAGAMAAVELVLEDTVPAILHRAGRSRQGEDIGAARHAGAGPRLDRRGADRLIAEPAEQLPEPGDRLVLDALDRFGGHIAAGNAGAA